jgi:hypothetical protein
MKFPEGENELHCELYLASCGGHTQTGSRYFLSSYFAFSDYHHQILAILLLKLQATPL